MFTRDFGLADSTDNHKGELPVLLRFYLDNFGFTFFKTHTSLYIEYQEVQVEIMACIMHFKQIVVTPDTKQSK